MISPVVLVVLLMHTFYSVITDIRTKRIPNYWNIAVFLIGIVYHLTQGGWENGAISLGSGLVVMICALSLQLFGAIGGGDAKWFAALAAWCGWRFALVALICSLVIAGFYGVLLLLYKREVIRLFRQWLIAFICFIADRRISHLASIVRNARYQIPFMSAVMPAIIIMIIYGGIP